MAFDSEEQDDNTLPEDFSPFFFLRDILSSADLAIMALRLVHKHLTAAGVPEQINVVLNLIPETQQLIATIPDTIDKIDSLRIVTEGALQSSAATELATHAQELVKG